MPVSLSQTENQAKIQHPPSVHVRIIFMKDVDFSYMVNLHILTWLQQITLQILNSNDQGKSRCSTLFSKMCCIYPENGIRNVDLITCVPN